MPDTLLLTKLFVPPLRPNLLILAAISLVVGIVGIQIFKKTQYR